MNIETVITITHFSVSVKQLIGFLRACIWLPADLVLGSRYLFSALAAQLLDYLASRELTFGQPVPLLRACCPISRVFGFSRTWFWAAGTFSPRLLPIFSSNQLPADLLLGSRYLFSALAAHFLEYLASRGLGFGQLAPFLRACCPFSHLISFPRTWFWTASTSSPRLLPISSSNQLPASLLLGSRYLFSAFAAQTSSRQTTAEQVLAHSKLKTAAINQQVHLPPTKKSPYGLFFANSFYIRRS